VEPGVLLLRDESHQIYRYVQMGLEAKMSFIVLAVVEIWTL
jgi:hypothetical protein